MCAPAGSGGYQLDLPVYALLKGQSYLAECGAKGWHPSDPIALVEWFSSAVSNHGEQLRRLVRYVKAWAEFQSWQYGVMPGGLLLTVLTVQNYYRNDRDDISMAMTFQAIESHTCPLRHILNPVDSGDDLTARMSILQFAHFQEAVAKAASDAAQAVQCSSIGHASDLWRKQFGDRFPAARSSCSLRLTDL